MTNMAEPHSSLLAPLQGAADGMNLIPEVPQAPPPATFSPCLRHSPYSTIPLPFGLYRLPKLLSETDVSEGLDSGFAGSGDFGCGFRIPAFFLGRGSRPTSSKRLGSQNSRLDRFRKFLLSNSLVPVIPGVIAGWFAEDCGQSSLPDLQRKITRPELQN